MATSPSFHVVRQITRREIVLVHADDPATALHRVNNGEGEVLDVESHGRAVSAEETVHSRARRGEPKAKVASKVLAEMGIEEVDGDGLFSQPATVAPAPDWEPEQPAPTKGQPQSFPAPRTAAPHTGTFDHYAGPWRPLLSGEIIAEGDEYHALKEKWSPITSSIGTAHEPSEHWEVRTRRP